MKPKVGSRITDRTFHYVPSHATDIRGLFKQVRDRLGLGLVAGKDSKNVNNVEGKKVVALPQKRRGSA